MLATIIGFFLLLISSSTTTCTSMFNVFPATKAHDEELQLQTYIVHLVPRQSQDPRELDQWYNSFLSTTSTKLPPPKPIMVHAYHHVITGFAAKMYPHQAKAMENLNDVLSITPDVMYHLQTTHSPFFLGLRQDSASGGFWKRYSNYGQGVVVGVIDTGLTPGHPSYNDQGIPPPPPTWKGKCELPGACNNKLIGLRTFVDGTTPADHFGHGSHTSSTAVGNWVANASVFGQANGTASGMAPLAHLAMYKVCHDFCISSDVMAGMDAAIEDDVDVISISMGPFFPFPFHSDFFAIATFSAMQKGIFVSCAAGNSGPYNGTIINGAPWMFTVGASTIDRRIRTTVSLGGKDKQLLDGESLYQPKDFDQKQLRPLVYLGSSGDGQGAYCLEGSLDHIDVKGKIVVCDVGYIGNPVKAKVVKDAGGAAMIVANSNISGESIAAEAILLAASHVGYKEGEEIKKYILSSPAAAVASIIFRGTILDLKSDPNVAFFSSRGPNLPSPGVLKPDIIGPGVDILAVWNESIDHQTAPNKAFHVIRGTSMSTPHLAGIAALLKRAHPEWSPAAIKSAMMTTAGQLGRNGEAIIDERGLPADVHAIGSGHVNPSKAIEPGLVFDIQPDDYIPYLCGLNFTTEQIQVIVKKTVSCSKTIPEAQLNYPSFTVFLQRGDSKTYTRIVTNVGEANSRYTIRDIAVPQGVSVVVNDGDQVLSFTAKYQKLTYRIMFSRDINDKEKPLYGQGHMTWVSGKYTVRTPFSFKF